MTKLDEAGRCVNGSFLALGPSSLTLARASRALGEAAKLAASKIEDLISSIDYADMGRELERIEKHERGEAVQRWLRTTGRFRRAG